MRILYTNLQGAWVAAILLFFSVDFAHSQITDDCSVTSQIIPLDGVCRNYGITSLFSNSSDTPALTCPGTSSLDGWYRIVTNSNTTQISIVGSGNMSSVRFTGLALYSGTCGSYTQVACNIPETPNASLLNVNVNPSTTYYLRVMRTDSDPSTANLSGTLCAVTTGTLPYNDDCAIAEVIPVGATPGCVTTVSGTTTPATSSGVPNCLGIADDDVWYSFVASAGSHIITATPGTMSDVVFETFSGSCGSLTSMECVDSTAGTSPEVGIASGLTVGNTYYIRVHSWGNAVGAGSFTLCMTTSDPGTYCTSTSGGDTYINNFSTTGGLTNITNNGSGLTAGGYANNTALSASQYAGLAVNFSAAFVGGTHGFNIWIDWNNDSDFSDSGEKVYATGSYVINTSGNFPVPIGTPVGNYRMRIRADYLSINPAACGAISDGETEDYTFSVSALICDSAPSAVTVAPSTTTATINWTAPASPPAEGYNYYYSTSLITPTFASVGSGATGAGVVTAGLTGLTAATTYYVWIRSNCGSGNRGLWVGPTSFTTGLTGTGVSICPGGSGSMSTVGSCTTMSNLGLTINGSWNAATDPIAQQVQTLLVNSTTCAFDTTNTANYTTFNFQVSITGSYTFTMTPNSAYDGMGYIVINPFTPGVCGSGTWVVGDDDSSMLSFEPSMSATLTTGITYTLITTVYGNFDITVTNSYIWNISTMSGGTLMTTSPGIIQWYTEAVGGTPIGTGSPFNPVGVAGSGLADTNTAGTTTYYVACSGNPLVRTPVDYVISAPTSTLSGSGSICATNTALEIVLTGTPPWNLTYVNDIGDPPVIVTGIMSSPHTIAVNPAITATYTITALSDAACGLGLNSGTAQFVAVVWTGADSSWSTASNWSTGSVPTSSDCVVIAAAPNYATVTASDIGEAHYLIIRSGGRLDLLNSRTITVTNRVTVEPGGIFNIENGSSLLQIDDVPNIGNINLRRNALLRLYDYTYWNSPVEASPAFTLGAFSPATPDDKFYSWSPSVSGDNGNWISETPASIMDPSKGYIIRAPLGTPIAVSFLHTFTFTGTPNNGDLTVPIGYGSVAGDNDQWNLIGNPYPSAITVAGFLDNIVNNPLLDNTVYFWTHNSMPSTANPNPFYGTFLSNYSESDYASCNSFGGIAACLTCEIPNGFIGAGQAFFIKSTGLPGNAQFNNGMRVALNNTQFFRTNEEPTTSYAVNFEKHRIWLNMTSGSSAFNQLLVGYAEGATLGYDSGLDGTRFSASSMLFYSVIPDQQLAIQAKPIPFNEADKIPLGFTVAVNGLYTIGIDHFDPLFENFGIYLEDQTLGIIHDLKQSPYNFTSSSGKFDDRLVLRFTSEGLSVNEDINNDLVAFITNNILNVRSSEVLENVQVFDICGKLIRTYIPQSELTNSWDFNYAQGAYLAKIRLQDGTVHTRKLIN